jgi:NADPH:quinone reductase-like Zn-dependent oxidoreductase
MAQILQAILLGSLLSKKNGKKMGFMGIAEYNQKDLACIRELLESGKVTPVIEESYPLTEVALAMRYLVEGHARGKVVVQISS